MLFSSPSKSLSPTMRSRSLSANHASINRVITVCGNARASHLAPPRPAASASNEDIGAPSPNERFTPRFVSCPSDVSPWIRYSFPSDFTCPRRARGERHRIRPPASSSPSSSSFPHLLSAKGDKAEVWGPTFSALRFDDDDAAALPFPLSRPLSLNAPLLLLLLFLLRLLWLLLLPDLLLLRLGASGRTSSNGSVASARHDRHAAHDSLPLPPLSPPDDEEASPLRRLEEDDDDTDDDMLGDEAGTTGALSAHRFEGSSSGIPRRTSYNVQIAWTCRSHVSQ